MYSFTFDRPEHEAHATLLLSATTNLRPLHLGLVTPHSLADRLMLMLSDVRDVLLSIGQHTSVTKATHGLTQNNQQDASAVLPDAQVSGHQCRGWHTHKLREATKTDA